MTKRTSDSSQHRVFLMSNTELRRLDAESVHLTVTSPPYVTTEFKRGQDFDCEGFLRGFAQVCTEVFRVTVPGGRFALNIADIITKYRYVDDDTISRENGLHVTARNLDGAIPALSNPHIVWEIKEYWGKTKGGSKMSDAVYECNLVGRELREFEERSFKRHVNHVVFVDGLEQWSYRKSDLARFVDLLYQGFIDCLIVGREVETKWKLLLEKILGGKVVGN